MAFLKRVNKRTQEDHVSFTYEKTTESRWKVSIQTTEKKTEQNNIIEKLNFHTEVSARRDWHYFTLSTALVLLQSDFSTTQVVTTAKAKSTQVQLRTQFLYTAKTRDQLK